jgi:hypothetical protein
MRINELLVESQQLDEGPFGQAVGKAVGGVAKGVGAVAGGIAGIPGAVKKGFKAGKAAVSGDPAVDAAQPAPAVAAGAGAEANWDEVTGAPLSAKAKAEYEKFSPEEKAKIQQAVEKEKAGAAPARTAPAAGTVAPAASTTAPAKKAGGGFIDQFKKGFAQGRGEPAADTTAAPAATTSAPAADAKPATTTPPPAASATPTANPEAEKAAKIGVGQINKIIPTLRTRDLKSLQTNLEKTIASKQKAAPAAPPADAAPAADPAATTTAPADAATAAPATTTTPADPNANAAPPNPGDQRSFNARTGMWGWKGTSGGFTSDEFDTPAPAKKPRAKKAKAPTQAEIDADRERNIGMTSDSVIRTGASLSETLARKVQEQKQRMFETALMSGTQSVFKK